ncbi:hypothetical protein H2198_004074 [Neophaeococcomyces mojaviensis]|uniref:Uncharacterized protein n=1 Tax=Neophaeococcomyces mojaviensis TaxID=3383035 RepID=A0ACC3A9W3_9EURO|nr:hypothetical protein H2198_004074 [Knufia sp. JES_112]
MRTTLLAALILTPIALAYVPPGYNRNVPPPLDEYRAAYRQFKQSQEKHKSIVQSITPPPTYQSHNQEVMNPGPVIPADPSSDKDSGRGGNGADGSQLTIADILPSQRQINIFAGLTRDIESLSGRLESAGSNTTLLAPLNSAMQGLPRKPWEDRPDDKSGISATSNSDKAAENLRRFVLEHVVPLSPWEEGKEHATPTLWDQQQNGDGARKIWWERRGGGDDGSQERKVIMPGEVVVEEVVGRVGNGEIWSLRGVINYQ